MASPEDIAVSREFMAAKRAYEISESRLRRLLEAHVKWQKATPPRRPVGAPSSVALPPLKTRPGPISKTDMNLHINAFVRNVEAHRDYYRGRPAEFAGAIRKAFGLSVLTQQLGLDVAERDVGLFVKYVGVERCEKAVREYRPNVPRSVAELFNAVEIAQSIPGASTMPAVMRAQKIVDSIALEF